MEAPSFFETSSDTRRPLSLYLMPWEPHISYSNYLILSFPLYCGQFRMLFRLLSFTWFQCYSYILWRKQLLGDPYVGICLPDYLIIPYTFLIWDIFLEFIYWKLFIDVVSHIEDVYHLRRWDNNFLLLIRTLVEKRSWGMLTIPLKCLREILKNSNISVDAPNCRRTGCILTLK